jgi:glycerol-3-phosphate dehydrogenase (NAD(P)+)
VKIAVIGAGSWGTTIASLLVPRGDVVLWARRAELADEIATEHTNSRYLPDFQLPAGLHATSNLTEAVAGAALLVMAVPSHGFREVLQQGADAIDADAPIISLSKGLEQGTDMRMTEVVSDVLTYHDRSRIGVLTGPNLAREIMAGQPAASVVSVIDEQLARQLQDVFMAPNLRVYTNPDVVGCEMAGALKNVMAIAAGMGAGLGYGTNSLATLITRALAELSRLGRKLGGDPRTFAGLAGMGDLIATCISPLSRNRQVGVRLGEGETLADIIADMNMVAEGVKTTPVVLDLATKHEVEMPIAHQVGRVLDGAPASEIVAQLMGRSAKPEVY